MKFARKLKLIYNFVPGRSDAGWLYGHGGSGSHCPAGGSTGRIVNRYGTASRGGSQTNLGKHRTIFRRLRLRPIHTNRYALFGLFLDSVRGGIRYENHLQHRDRSFRDQRGGEPRDRSGW